MPALARTDALSNVAVRRVAAAPLSAAEESEYVKKLLALGYLSPGEAAPLAPTGGDRPGMTESAWNNLGSYDLETRKDRHRGEGGLRRVAQAQPVLLLADVQPGGSLPCAGDTKKAEDWLFRALAVLKTDPAVAVSGWAREYQRDAKIAAARSLLDRAAKTYPDNEVIARERALLLYTVKDCRGALETLARFEASTSDVQTVNDLALFQTCLADRDAVIRLLERSLAMKPDQPGVAQALARVRAVAP